MTAPTDLWCSRCPGVATHDELVSSDGGKTAYTASFCDTCAWARRNATKIAPKKKAARR